MAQRHISAIIAFFAVLIVQHGMAVRERAAAGIFTGNAHRRAFGHQACISDGFGHAPINRLLAGGHGLAAFQQLFHRIVQRKALRKLVQINGAQDLEELATPPGNHLEALSGDRDGQYSIRISLKWRICFVWAADGVYDVEIVDYH